MLWNKLLIVLSSCYKLPELVESNDRVLVNGDLERKAVS